MKILYHDIVTPCGQPADVVISGLQKFIRRGMTEEAVRAAYELYLTGEELTEYLWKRLLVISAEDIGMGTPMAPVVVKNLQNAANVITRENPDYTIFIVQAVRYLCSCEKDRGSSILSSVTKRRIRDGEVFEFPDYVFDMHTVKGQSEERGVEHFFEQAAVIYPEVKRSEESAAYWNKLEQELIRRKKEDVEEDE